MLKTFFIASIALCYIVVTAISAQDPARKTVEKLTAEQIEKKFYRGWLATEHTASGKSTKDPYKLFGYEFSKDGTYSWGRRGELSAGGTPSVEIDVTTEPMRLLFTAGTGYQRKQLQTKTDRIQIRPGIFQFDGDNLILVVGEHWIVERKLEQGKDYAERPNEFKSTSDNKFMLTILKPAQIYDQD